MRITSKEFWDKVLCKLIETFISVKIWILGVIIYFVVRLYCVADELRNFMIVSVFESQKMQVLSVLQSKIYDIGTTLLLSGIVVIVLSRVSFQMARLKKENGDSDVESIKDEFVQRSK